ncbi:MAG: flavoprotein monooxygenase acting on aromatic compound [SAR324 cluster bacterium]|uniref:Flavoprotein monooxygenase acting on aromatic compound n=1 Tax=SAR324 cluster bacterium TaxID=2024889 RepID=A0A2A4STL5_9DELT|nr:MAG: flavoprotein monooxygenase acting on aromatic compound [SAR324 cluster bacterium]
MMNISILGAGVTGLSSAIILKQQGYDVTVYERQSNISQLGAGIVCWPNASFVLREMGLLDQIAAHAGKIQFMQRLDNQGQVLGTLDIRKLDAYMGDASFSILRRDLMNVLADKVESLGVKIHFNHQVEAIIELGKQGTLIQFSNGSSIEPKLTIAADGRMNSKARLYVLGENQAKYQGFVNWIGITTLAESDAKLMDQNKDSLKICDFWGKGERFGLVPISTRQIYWAGAASMPLGNIEKDGAILKKRLLKQFSHWPEPIQQVISHSQVESIKEIYLHDHQPSKTWFRNTLLLLGDCAHAPLPTSSQGACQGIEDAWHLGQLLQEFKPENNLAAIPALFESFTQRRYQKTSEITLAARQFAQSLFNQNQESIEQRNGEARNANYDEIVKGMARFWGAGLPACIPSKSP